MVEISLSCRFRRAVWDDFRNRADPRRCAIGTSYSQRASLRRFVVAALHSVQSCG
jgi:hypothetical protein